MISEGMYALGTKKSTIRAIFEYGKKRIAEVGAENVYDFSLGNPNIPAPSCINKAIADILSEMDSCSVHGYTVASGDPEVRSVIAESLNRKFAMDFSGDNIFMTSGAAAAITICFKALHTAGDEFIAIAPYFPEYSCFVESVGSKLAIVPADTKNFQIDVDKLEMMVKPNTKAIIINSPNNPSGAVYSEETIQAVAHILEKKQSEYGHSIFIISDEPYRALAYGVDVPYLPNYYSNSLVCYSWSKSFSLAGERIGYIAVPNAVHDFDKVYGAIAGAARVLTHVNASSLFQRVVAKCIDAKIDRKSVV